MAFSFHFASNLQNPERRMVSQLCNLSEPWFPISKMETRTAGVVGGPHEILLCVRWCLQYQFARFLLKGPGPPTPAH